MSTYRIMSVTFKARAKFDLFYVNTSKPCGRLKKKIEKAAKSNVY